MKKKTYTLRYHQRIGDGYTTATCTKKAKSPRDAVDFMFQYVQGLIWVRVQGRNYGPRSV